MTTKDYLNQVIGIDKRIKHLLHEADGWYDISKTIGRSDLSQPKIQTNLNVNKLENVVSEAMDYQNKCIELAKEKIELKKTIFDQISSLIDCREGLYYDILYSRYITGKATKDIAKEMEYSYRTIMTTLKDARNEFEKRYGYLYLDKEI